MSHKQIVLLTLLTKLWEKYLDVNVAIDVLEKQVSENAGAFFSFFFFCTCPFRKVVQSPRRSYQRLWKLEKKNNDDSNCMQMSLVMNMQFIFEDDENDELS